MTDLSERLRKLLQKHVDEWQTSQVVLAQHLGIGRSAVSRMLSGERQISAEELFGIIKFFGMSFEQVEKALLLSEDDKLDLYISSMTHRKNDPSGDNLSIEGFDKNDGAMSIPKIILGSSRISKSSRLKWIRMYDDAMSPSLEKGDILVFDESIKGASGLFVIEASPGSYSVRRLDGGCWEGEDLMIHVGADNPKFRSFETSLLNIKPIGLVLVRITDRV